MGELDEIRLATGGLSPVLLAKVLRFVVEDHDILELGSGGFTVGEIDVLRSASDRVTATVEGS